MQQKVPTNVMISPTDGPLVSKEGQIVTESQSEIITEPSGTFDPLTGVLTLSLPNVGSFNITGLPTTSDMGSGPAGQMGARGRDGIAGLNPLDGQRGADGCMGADGSEGLPGKDGPRGREGDPGGPGPIGEEGPAGQDGKFAVYFQQSDPGPVGAGSVWIRPRAKAAR